MNVNHACRLYQDTARVRSALKLLQPLYDLLTMGGAKEAAQAVQRTMGLVGDAGGVGLRVVVDREIGKSRKHG